MCGENFRRWTIWHTVKGSPPRVRGKQFPKKYSTVAEGITPACAGKTVPFVKQRKCKEDHPRVCGENEIQRYNFAVNRGSPPRVRGKQKRGYIPRRKQGITPACAGKTFRNIHCTNRRKDHPRVCGENVEFYENLKPDEGSPPRVRGKHFGNGVFPWLILVLSLDLL